jgi:hypothetical protein
MNRDGTGSTRWSCCGLDLRPNLTAAWSDATTQFSSAVKEMTRAHISTMSEADYIVLRGKAETARLASENARLLLELHRNEHGC